MKQLQAHATGTNLLQNGSFENISSNWLSPWSLNVDSTGDGTITQDNTTQTDGVYSAQINVTQSTNPWDVQLGQSASISAGRTYTLTFYAKAATTRSISIALQQNTSPWTVYDRQDFNLTTGWQQYSYTFTPTTTDSAANLWFNVAQTTGQVWLDNISLVDTGPMPAPSGYTNLIFDDQFQGTSLDTTKWYPQIGDQQTFPWNNFGNLPSPLSGPNAGGFSDAYYSPAQLTVNNGLTITAKRDISQPGYNWVSGVIDTHDKFKFNGGYLQVKAQMPDSNTGAWAGIWSLEGTCEIDTQESGFLDFGQSLANQEMTSHIQQGSDCPSVVGTAYNAGVDLSAGYHIYGMEYKPGQSVTTYLDGQQVAQWTNNIPTGAMTIILNLQVASTSASGWRTVESSSTPDPLTMHVAEVQVWQAPTPTPTPTPMPTSTPTPTPTPLPNIIQTPSFESTGANWLSPWTFNVTSPASGSISQTTPAQDGTYAAKITVKKTNSNAWYLQLHQAGLALTTGHTYTISFWAKASAARTLEWGLQQNASPFAWYTLQTSNLTTSWQQFSTTFTPSETDNDVRLNFDFANSSPIVYLDNVSIK